MTTYRTRTYLAGDWTGDQDIINKLYEWNNSKRLNLHFIDAHELTQARDSSLACSIKRSLTDRLNISKTFVLIVGSNTLNLRKGGCQYCASYDSYHWSCCRGMHVDYKSFIDFECEKAVRDNLKIVVIYNYASVDKSKCPESVRNKGTHIRGNYYSTDGKAYWNYTAIRDAIMK